MAFHSLRDFIAAVDNMKDVKIVEGADWDLEIGAIIELMAERGTLAYL